MNQNSFQKNSFVKVNTNPIINNDPNKLGRRTVEEIKLDMVDAKNKDFLERRQMNNQELKTVEVNHGVDFKSRINGLNNINRG